MLMPCVKSFVRFVLYDFFVPVEERVDSGL